MGVFSDYVKKRLMADDIEVSNNLKVKSNDLVNKYYLISVKSLQKKKLDDLEKKLEGE